MKSQMAQHRGLGSIAVGTVFVLAGALYPGVQSAEAAAPPLKRTYFTIMIGLDSPYTWQAECLRFKKTDICIGNGLCGTWSRTEAAGPETGVSFVLSYEEDGVPVEITGQARIDNRGKKDSLGGAASVRMGSSSVNFALGGRATSRKKCSRLLQDFNNSPASRNASCVARADFVDPADSMYVLPYPVGAAYRVSQSYCYRNAGHVNQLAYDFEIPVGDDVIAARAGTVREVRESSPDDGRGEGLHNFVFIEHDDGTTGFYAHLQQNSVAVEVGDHIDVGQRLAGSGYSGEISEPHLHFGVYRTYPPVEGDDLAVSFRNADGRLDELGGLMWGEIYSALPH